VYTADTSVLVWRVTSKVHKCTCTAAVGVVLSRRCVVKKVCFASQKGVLCSREVQGWKLYRAPSVDGTCSDWNIRRRGYKQKRRGVTSKVQRCSCAEAGVVSLRRCASQLASSSSARTRARGCAWQPLPPRNEHPPGTNRSSGQRQGCCNACVQCQRSEGVPAPVQAGKGHARLVRQRRGHDQQVCAVRARRHWQVNAGIYIMRMYIHIQEYYVNVYMLVPENTSAWSATAWCLVLHLYVRANNINVC